MARKDQRLRAATRRGEEVAAAQGCNALPVDAFAIAEANSIVVKAMPPSSRGFSGLLQRVGEEYGIAYATHIDSEGFRRFSISHELGHYFLEGHIEALFAKSDIHESHAGFTSGEPYEMEADHFAAGLLMPRKLFVPALERAGQGIAAIQTLAAQCQTSLPATAIQYAQRTADAVAVIVSTGDRVDYCFMSDELEEQKGLNWLRRGEALPPATATRALNQSAQKVRNSHRVEAVVQLATWFGGGPDVEMVEDVLGLGEYGKTLTVLYAAEEFPSVDDEEDATLEPRFSKSKRRR